jgi:hypothetical protein
MVQKKAKADCESVYMGVAKDWGCTGVGRLLECDSVTIKLQSAR